MSLLACLCTIRTLDKAEKHPLVPANIYRSALAPANLLKFLYELHLWCKSNRIQNPALISSKKPLTSLLPSRAISANACKYKHTTRFMEVNDGLCTQSRSSILGYLLNAFLPNRGRKKKKAFTAAIMDKDNSWLVGLFHCFPSKGRKLMFLRGL